MTGEEFYDEFKAAIRHLGEWPGTELHVHLSGDSFIMTAKDGRTASFTVGSAGPDKAKVLKQYPCFCRPRNCKLTSETIPDNQYCKRLRT